MAFRLHTSAAFSALGTTWLLLNICFRSRNVAADECGTKFVDPSSSTVLAPIVFQGSVSSISPSSRNPHIQSANITIGKVYKGMDVLKRLRVPVDGGFIMVDRFAAEEDPEECVASMSAVKTENQHMFFTRPTSSRGVLAMTALPLPAEHRIALTVESSLCDTCVTAPQIQRVMCRQCARAPTIRKINARKVRMGQKARLGCYARGKPHPTFQWMKAGVPVTSGSGGIAVRLTNTSSILIIRKANSAHGGQYVCRVENEIGRAEEIVFLEVTKRPPATPKPKYNVHNAPDRYVCPGGAVCMNGGTCYYSPSLDLSVCECPTGYEGVKCENEVATRESGNSVANIAGNGSGDASSKDMNLNNSTTGGGITRESSQRTSGTLQGTSHSHQIIANNFDTQGENNVNDQKSIRTTPKERTTDNPKENMSEPRRSGSFKTSEGRSETSNAVESSGLSVDHPSAGRFYSNVDDQALQFILSSLQNKELEADPCRSTSFCLNGGTCRYVPSLDIEVCVCSKEFSGQKCEKSLVQKSPPVPERNYTIDNAPDRHACSINKCLNGGTCYYSPSLDLSICECTEGFEGIQCQNGINSSTTAFSTELPTIVSIKPTISNGSGEEQTMPNNNTSMSVSVSRENLVSQSQDPPTPPFETENLVSQSQDPSTPPSETENLVFQSQDPSTPPSETENLVSQSQDPSTPSAKTAQNAILLKSTMAATTMTNGDNENSATTATTTSTVHEINTSEDPMSKFETSDKPSQISKQKERTKSTKDDVEADGHRSNVDGEPLKHIHARLKKSRLKAGRCKSKSFCLNGGKCRYIHKLALQVCLCRKGFSGRRCEQRI